MRKQEHGYAVRMVRLESGERLPMLVSKAGLPLFDPTLFAVTELRARNRSAATIEQALRAIMALTLVLERLGVDLEARLAERKLLEDGEIEEVLRSCRRPLEALSREITGAVSGTRKCVSLERVRMAATADELREVDTSTAAIRAYYISGYLRWRIDKELLNLSITRDRPAHAELAARAEVMLRTFRNRAPAVGRGHALSKRQGLSERAVAKLLEVIQPDSPENPWEGTYAKERNRVIVRWLLDLGLRRGELLGVRIENIDFQTREVRIDRRADDPDDPRRHQPNTKTQGRLVPLSEELTRLTHRYITDHRRSAEGARRHPFLFVAAKTGAPMTLSALNKVFAVLRRGCPDLPDDLSPHVLRHTWNDRFSALMDKQKVSEEAEKKMRSRLMGWSETSGTAAVYTRRHVQRKARAASLELQERLRREGSSNG